MEFIIKQEKNNFTVEYSGQPGLPGSKGNSAYQVWLSQGNTGTEQDFLNSLKGQDGNNGQSSNISIGTTTTLDSGENATVTNSGTALNPILNFGIPKGQDGSGGGGGTSSIENIGDGIGIYKGQFEESSQLKSLKTINQIITLNNNIETDTIDIGIDLTEFNNVVGSNLDGINEQLTILQTNIDTVANDLTDNVNYIYEDMNNNIVGIYQMIGPINTSIDNINNTIGSMSGQLNFNTIQINNVNNSISSINDTITYLQDRLTVVETSVSQLQNRVDSTENNITNLQLRMTEVEGNSTTNGTDISTNTSDISGLKTRMTTAETNIGNNTSAISSLSSLNTKVLPSGGSPGQVLQKNSATDYDASWLTVSSNAETSQNTVIAFGVAVNNGFTTNNNTFQTINVASTYVSGSADSPIPAFTVGKELYDGRARNLYRVADNPTNTGTSSYYSPVFIRYVGNSIFGGFSGDFDFCFEQNNDQLSKFFVGDISEFIGVSSIASGPSNLLNCVGFGFDSSDSIFNVYVNGSSGTALKIPVSSFTGNLIASDYQARVIQNPYFVTYKVNRGGSVITFTFTHINSGRTGTYTLNNPAKLPARNKPLRPMFNMTCGTASMGQMDGFSVYSFYLTRNYR